MLLRELFLDECDVTPRPGARLRDGIAEKDDPLTFRERLVGGNCQVLHCESQEKSEECVNVELPGARHGKPAFAAGK
jgi:hypothetical protein